MKKLFALLLACMMLFLTACNGTPHDGTVSENSQNQQNLSALDLKDKIILNGMNSYLDTPSRVVFEKTSHGDIFYYSKADGKGYIYCFDPLCDHSGGKCLANPDDSFHIPNFEIICTFFINNRFYITSPYGQIYSFSFDGSDLQIEYGKDSFTMEEVKTLQYTWSLNSRVYDKYIYIRMEADENGNPHTLRFNTETKEMEDLTEKTGNFVAPAFFYNGEIYGRVRNQSGYGWYKADLDMNHVEYIDAIPMSSCFSGSLFFGLAYDDEKNYKERKEIGLKSYDMKTGETTVFTYEMLGLEEYSPRILYVDENYIYFYQAKKTFLQTYTDHKGNERKLYKENDGKIYRVKHDGTECVCIHDSPNFEIVSYFDAFMADGKLVLKGHYVDVRDGKAVYWDSGIQVGTIGEDGKIDKFEIMELIY